MHSYDFQTKVVQSMIWLSDGCYFTYYPGCLEKFGYPVLLDLTLECHGNQPRPDALNILFNLFCIGLGYK